MVRIVAVDRVPLARSGLAAMLGALGHRVDAASTDDLSWLEAAPPDAVVLTVRDQTGLELVAKVNRAFTDAAVVVVLTDPIPEFYIEALQAGAHGAVAWDTDADQLARVLQAALERLTLLPVDVAHALATRAGGPRLIDDEQTLWLRHLARGATIAELSRSVGYSERSMYRLLASLYQRLGASNRSEAVVAASRRGLI